MTTTHDVINPATEALVRSVELATVEEADAAIARASAAGPAWRAVAPGDRALLLRRFSDLVGEARAIAASASSTVAGSTLRTSCSVAGLMTSCVVVTVARILSCAPSR